MSYCASRFHTLRRPSCEVMVGGVGVGGDHPLRLQSMTTSDTRDVAATVRESIALAEAGCEIVRITAPNVVAARCLREIRDRFSAAGFGAVPLVADIHFLPTAAMEAVEHVEKVRVNPGNYADRKKFAVREYSDREYEEELQRLHDAFSPLVRRCRALGRALRIGTNHGSLCDRIMNRYGDTPLGMVESALEFLRIAEAHSFRALILSMKASNPKVMIQAYRLLVERMASEGMHYPLHLGVTEAGDGEDGRIKSAIGIGSLLLDGLGDTIRVSLTEDSVYELPVARAIAGKAMSLWRRPSAPATPEAIDPYSFTRRETTVIGLGSGLSIGAGEPPRVIVRAGSPARIGEALAAVAPLQDTDTPAEGILVTMTHVPFGGSASLPGRASGFYVLETTGERSVADGGFEPPPRALLLRRCAADDAATLSDWVRSTRKHGCLAALDIAPAAVATLGPTLRALGANGLVFTLGATPATAGHALGGYRQLAEELRRLDFAAPIWIRSTAATAVGSAPDFLSRLLDASILIGGLLADGIGDLISIETEDDPRRATRLAYNVLQGAGARISRTEFVACPSCGRTLFDLQTTTQRIREKTGHLKDVKIAIMGCIVNGPGEMADADFGYVGGAPGRINLYVGRECVQYNIPEAEADARLITLLRAHGRWTDPVASATPTDGLGDSA